MQLSGRWRVKAPELIGVFRQAYRLLNRIRHRGLRVHIAHIYREYNKEADAKANWGADGLTAQYDW